MKEDYQKALKKVTSFFLLNSVPFNRQNDQKQKRPGSSDQPLYSGYEKSLEKSLYYRYVLFDQV